EPRREGEGRSAQLRPPRRPEHQAKDDLSVQGAQSESRSGRRTNMMARHRLAFALAFAVRLPGCARGCTSSRPPIPINPSRYSPPKVLPQTASDFFYNGASMREPVPGTVAIGGLKEDGAFFTGKGTDAQFVATIPVTVDAALLERGHQRYVIYCRPCHDAK